MGAATIALAAARYPELARAIVQNHMDWNVFAVSFAGDKESRDDVTGRLLDFRVQSD